MTVKFHKKFEKLFEKLPKKVKDQFFNRIELFLADQHNPRLNNHSLQGNYNGYRSINITGDIRAIYKQISVNEALFITIGSHSELYN